MKKVIIFEDHERVLQVYRELADDLESVTFIFCTNVIDATPGFLRQHFEAEEHPAVVVMDACLPGDTPNTIPLVRAIRQMGYSGPLVAVSSDDHYNQLLCQVGCDHALESKAEGLRYICQILGQ